MEKSFKDRVLEARDAVTSITADEASRLQGTSGVVFLDPRPASAIAGTTGLIPGAWNVGLEDISRGQLPEALADRQVHVITACQAGPMGAIAAHELTKQGFRAVHYIEGGTQAWLDAGLPTTGKSPAGEDSLV